LQGILDVEGTETFVNSIYEDFKTSLIRQISDRSVAAATEAGTLDVKVAEPERTSQRKRRASTRRISGPDAGKSKVAEYSPKFNPNLDLGKLDDFYDEFDFKNHREKILVFSVFMREELKTAPCSADDIFSCYQTLKTKTEIPEAFVQALRDAQNKDGFVEFVSPQEIKITIAGQNFFNQKLKRKERSK
jgi:hypothetical protein